MTASQDRRDPTAEEWQRLLEKGYGAPTPMRRMMGKMFHGERCKVCYSPLSGAGAAMVGMMGRGPTDKSATLCKHCAEAHPIGTGDIDLAVLVAGVRDIEVPSDGRSENALSERLRRFDSLADQILIEREAIVDRLAQGRVVAFFITGFAGRDYSLPAIQAAEALVRAAGYGGVGHPWLPVAAAIHVGAASAGNVETEQGIDFTAMGPMIDAACALREHAAPGEVVITEDIHERLVTDYPDSEGYPTFDRRIAELRDTRQSIPLRVMRLAGAGSLAS